MNLKIFYDWGIIISNSLDLTEKVLFLFILLSFLNKQAKDLISYISLDFEFKEKLFI